MASVGIEPVADTASHLYSNLWIKEIGRAYLYCRCTRHKELYCITGVTDATKSNNRYLDSLSHLPRALPQDR